MKNIQTPIKTILIHSINLSNINDELDMIVSILSDLSDQLKIKSNQALNKNDALDLFDAVDLKQDEFKYLLSKIDDINTQIGKSSNDIKASLQEIDTRYKAVDESKELLKELISLNDAGNKPITEADSTTKELQNTNYKKLLAIWNITFPNEKPY